VQAHQTLFKRKDRPRAVLSRTKEQSAKTALFLFFRLLLFGTLITLRTAIIIEVHHNGVREELAPTRELMCMAHRLSGVSLAQMVVNGFCAVFATTSDILLIHTPRPCHPVTSW
jgi:hypothetical protein